MKKSASLSCLVLAYALLPVSPSGAQDDAPLRVVRSTVNAESETAELCLEFNKALAATSPARLASNLHLETAGKTVTPANLSVTGPSLCLFPLERGVSYQIEVNGLRSDNGNDEKMALPYKASFSIPDRSASLAFVSKNGGINAFGSYDRTVTLRAVNVAHANVDVYRITDSALMARVWQDRAQTTLAPTESAYLARNKGQAVWHGEEKFTAAANITSEHEISLRDRLPTLPAGLYLVVADAGKDSAKPASKGLSPLAAAWFTKSDFSLRAVRDSDGIHAFASKADASGGKPAVHLAAFNKKPEQLSEAQGDANGLGVIAYPPKLADKEELVSVVGSDANGNVAFADIENLPALSGRAVLGTIHTAGVFALPGQTVDVSLVLTPTEKMPTLNEQSLLRLSQGDAVYSDVVVPALTQASARISLTAPAAQGAWNLRWQKTDGTLLAEGALRVADNADAPHLEVLSDRDSLDGGGTESVTIKSLAASGKPAPLTQGHVLASWQRLDPATFGWKDYHFGTPNAILGAETHVADFLTDEQGVAQLRLNLPKPPQERGLYQAVLKIVAEPDSGVADAAPLLMPLRPEGTVIGIKPLAADARFTQNGMARFAIVALSSEGKPREAAGLSYQVYEEGRSFAWYQDEGRWKYKPEAQLRPIGGGALSVKGDASSVLEWPVTAGNYRLEIFDANSKLVAQIPFSAGWDSAGASLVPVQPLAITLPKILQPGREAVAHVTLPEAAMVTATLSDAHLRKVVHEARPKGDNTITFTPAADWSGAVNLTVEAVPQNALKAGNVVLRGHSVATITQGKPAVVETPSASVSLLATDNPAAVALRKDNAAVLNFGIVNNGDAPETYHYAFTASAGLKIDGGDKGDITLNGKQSRSLSLPLSGVSVGVKDLRLEVSGAHTPRQSRSWNIAVLPKDNSLSSGETASVAPKQNLLSTPTKTKAAGEEGFAFVSRRPMDGVAEILSYVFAAHPFTTAELAASIEALRLWGDTLVQAGMAPEFMVTARRQEQRAQLLRRQNDDGGFAALRDGDSTMEDTAAALTALGPDLSEQAKPAKTLAISWLKQRLSNTWMEEKERAPRAAAYAALAAADAIDAASLHYFSDTSAASVLPAVAEADIAAAFKQNRDPNAAAFWIKKMLDENSGAKDIALLNALSATDALSSDDVNAATKMMADALRRGTTPSIKDAAALLRAIAANVADAGKMRVANNSESREMASVLVLRGNDTSWRNNDAQPLFVTNVAQDGGTAKIQGTTLTRHFYRLNGVEVIPPAKPLRGEVYLAEIKGTLPSAEGSAPMLVQDGGDYGLRPLGCPLSAKLDTLAFIPWFTTQSLTPVKTCEYSSHDINAVIAPAENDATSFSIVYFTRIDAPTLSMLAPPRLRSLK